MRASRGWKQRRNPNRELRCSRSRALVVHGDPGIGKTALLGHAVARARELGFRVVAARGMETESDIPFAGLSELLASLLVDPGLDALPEAQASALASVSPRSYINRAAALYRHFAGIPAAREPPLAP